MSHNQYTTKVQVTVEGRHSILIEGSGYTYNSVADAIRQDLDNATENVIRIIKEVSE